jgi:hypothetical protein
MSTQSVPRLAGFRPSVLAISCITALLAVGCLRPTDASSPITVRHTVSPDPPQIGRSRVILKLADRAEKPVSGARITLEADMSHPGMAPVFGDANETGPGQYEADLEFAMAGDWVIVLHVRLAGGQMLERQFKVSGVQPK